ncbi:MAG: transposase, partial [Tannerella sp.]|nr:transposase [Tannerella sp.]
MDKSSQKKSAVKRITQFEMLRYQVAGIDVSDNHGMMVAYSLNEKEIAVEEFGCYTCDLHRLVARLKEYHIQSVAMEATGVYRIALFLLLQEEGFEVYLVNARHVKNVTGRKNDESDAEWIQKLHRCGLLSASFQPDRQTKALRSVVRHRSSLVEARSSCLNRMQKALEQMNIKIHTVISDIDGKTGLRILEAIFEGERDAETLASLCDGRIKAS